MTQDYTRRDWIKSVGAAGVAASARRTSASEHAGAAGNEMQATGPATSADGEISELFSTSDVFIPPRGRSFMKFSFDFPEPAVGFGGHRFSFLIFTEENTY